MKTKGLILIVLFVLTSTRLAAQKSSRAHQLPKQAELSIIHPWQLSINRIQINFMPLGGLNPNTSPISKWDGWGGYDQTFDMIFDQGLWVTAKRNGSIGSLPYLWGSAYSPGPIINGQPARKVRPQDSLRYRVYGITRGDTPETNSDVSSWPSDLGAPVDGSGNPLVRGDQMLWMVYNGADTASITAAHYFPMSFYPDGSPKTVLPVEVRQTIFEHFGEVGDTSIWANTVFEEWAIYNKGPDPLDSVYLSLWCDIDFYDASHTIPAVDTIAQTGYCWYGLDSTFGAVGYALLYGPAVPSSANAATFFGQKRVGYRNLPLTSFWGIIDDGYQDNYELGPPSSLWTAWNVVRGLNKAGAPVIDSVTRQQTKFPFSGDPITGKGSLFPYRLVGGGAGFMMTTGPCSIAPGDSQWVMMAIVPTNKLNGVDAINRLRASAAYLRSLPYDFLVSKKDRRSVPINPLPVFDIPTSFVMGQNYPNPFNGGTIFPFDLPEKSNVRIEAFDVLGRSTAVLVDQTIERGHRNVSWFPTTSSGVYFVRLIARSLESSSVWSGIKKVVLTK